MFPTVLVVHALLSMLAAPTSPDPPQIRRSPNPQTLPIPSLHAWAMLGSRPLRLWTFLRLTRLRPRITSIPPFRYVQQSRLTAGSLSYTLLCDRVPPSILLQRSSTPSSSWRLFYRVSCSLVTVPTSVRSSPLFTESSVSSPTSRLPVMPGESTSLYSRQTSRLNSHYAGPLVNGNP